MLPPDLKRDALLPELVWGRYAWSLSREQSDSRKKNNVLEKVLGMGGGYVLEFNDATFGQLFSSNITSDIHSSKSSSELRHVFGCQEAARILDEKEPDAIVGDC